MSPGDIASAQTGAGDLDPLVISVESADITLGVLVLLCTPLAWLLARGRFRKCHESETDLGDIAVRQPRTRRSAKINMSYEVRSYRQP